MRGDRKLGRLHSQAHAEHPNDWRAARDRFAQLLIDAGYDDVDLDECVDALDATPPDR